MDKAVETPVQGFKAVLQYLMGGPTGIPADVRKTLSELMGDGSNPAISTVEIAELIYARQDELPAELLSLGAELAVMTGILNYNGMGNEGRGYAIAKTLRSKPGVKTRAPAESTLKAPEPAERYVPKKDEEESKS